MQCNTGRRGFVFVDPGRPGPERRGDQGRSSSAFVRNRGGGGGDCGGGCGVLLGLGCCSLVESPRCGCRVVVGLCFVCCVLCLFCMLRCVVCYYFQLLVPCSSPRLLSFRLCMYVVPGL